MEALLSVSGVRIFMFDRSCFLLSLLVLMQIVHRNQPWVSVGAIPHLEIQLQSNACTTVKNGAAPSGPLYRNCSFPQQGELRITPRIPLCSPDVPRLPPPHIRTDWGSAASCPQLPVICPVLVKETVQWDKASTFSPSQDNSELVIYSGAPWGSPF